MRKKRTTTLMTPGTTTKKRRMTMTTPMDLLEARRRFEKLLVLAGYSHTGNWAEKIYKPEKNVSSMVLNGMPDTRAVLWFEKGEWEGMISIAVGENGEFPMIGGKIQRVEKQSWKPLHFNYIVKYIDDHRSL